MSNLYNTLFLLCNKRGITLAKMCRDCGISKSLPTDLKAERRSGVSTKTAQKIADYFGISVESLLTGEIEKAPTEIGEGSKVFEKFSQLDEADKAYISGQIDALLSKRK